MKLAISIFLTTLFFSAPTFAEPLKGVEQAPESSPTSLSDDCSGGMCVLSVHSHYGSRWQKLAEQGDRQAQALLGGFFQSGDGTKQDYSEASKWFRKAAEQGTPLAQMELGRLYANGTGVKQSWSEALFWTTLSLDGPRCHIGDPIDEMPLDEQWQFLHFRSQVKLDQKRFESHLSDKQIAAVQERVDTWNIVPSSLPKACKKTALELEAEKGIPEAQYLLAQRYALNLVIPRQTAKWQRRAAERGYAPAQFTLGNEYQNGYGSVPKNYTQALQWYEKAASQGYAEAMSAIGLMYSQGMGAKKDAPGAVKWYQKAAEQNNPNGQLNLADSYANGKGVKLDWAEAYFWYRLSIKSAATNPGWKPFLQPRMDEAAQHLTPTERAVIEKHVSNWAPIPTPATGKLPPALSSPPAPAQNHKE